MNDGYEEILVKRQKTPKDTLVKGLVIGVVAVLLAGGIFFFNPIFLAAGMVLGMLAYYLILPMLDLEYEYLYVGGDIDIDKIMAKRKRKKVASYSKDSLEVMAPTGSEHLRSFLGNLKVKDYTSGDPEKKTWTLVYGGEQGSEAVCLELTGEIAQDMRRFAPRKVFFVVGYRLKGYEQYLVIQNREQYQGRFRIFAFIPTLVTPREEKELRKSGVFIRLSIESSPMGLYKSFAYEIFKRRSSVLLALDGNSAGANMIQEARNARYECRTYVSVHSRSLKTKADSLEGYVTTFARETEVLPKILVDIK